MIKSLNSNYVLVKKIEKPKEDGFTTVEVQDDFVYKGEIVQLPSQTMYVDNTVLVDGMRVFFGKYAPDSHEVKLDGVEYRCVHIKNILGIL